MHTQYMQALKKALKSLKEAYVREEQAKQQSRSRTASGRDIGALIRGASFSGNNRPSRCVKQVLMSTLIGMRIRHYSPFAVDVRA